MINYNKYICYLLIICMFGSITASSGTKSTTAKPKTTSKTQTTAKPKTTTTTTVTSTSCSTSCGKEFAECHNHFKGWFGCSRAYTICRTDILDDGQMARFGCKKKCKDTTTMTSLKSCTG